MAIKCTRLFVHFKQYQGLYSLPKQQYCRSGVSPRIAPGTALLQFFCNERGGGRDYKNIHTDVSALEALGLIVKDEKGSLTVPYDEIVIHAGLTEAA